MGRVVETDIPPEPGQATVADDVPHLRSGNDSVERTTMTGNDMRSYRCDHCKQEHIVNFGPALWQILHDAREREKDA